MIRTLLFTALALAAPITWSQVADTSHRFLVFDATTFDQKPDLKEFGLKPITVVYAGYMWAGDKVPNTTDLPDKSRVNAIALLASQSTSVLAIDIEHWNLTGDPAAVGESVKKYQTVIKWFKASAPSLKVGLYGAPPVRNYWDSLQEKNTPQYVAWKMENDALAPIAQEVDVLFPSIYTFYEDRKGWQKYAVAQILEARRLAGGKPVYVFLWPQYHMSNKKLGSTFLPGDYWQMELETARKHADGVVIWCCSNRQTWNDKAAWWQVTRGFLKEVGPSR